MAAVLLAGRVSRLAGAMGPDGPACNFRLGNVPCRAHGQLAEQICGRQGFPLHEIQVTGTLDGKVLVIDSLVLVD